MKNIYRAYEDRIVHLEGVVADIVDRITKAEDKTNQPEQNTKLATRSTKTQDITQLTKAMEEMETRMHI